MNFLRRLSHQQGATEASAISKQSPESQTTDKKQDAQRVQATATTRDTDSIAPLIVSTEDAPQPTKRRRSSLFKKSPPGEKKTLISDSGPYIFAFDPRTGKEILQRNPHWPYEDSWKREEQRETRGETDSTIIPGGLGFGVNNY